jgi:hypothetical protein
MRPFLVAALFIFIASITVCAQDSTSHAADTVCHCVKTTPPIKTFTSDHLYYSLSPVVSESYTKDEVQLDFDFHMNSNSIPTTFAGAFLTGKDISVQLKESRQWAMLRG